MRTVYKYSVRSQIFVVFVWIGLTKRGAKGKVVSSTPHHFRWFAYRVIEKKHHSSEGCIINAVGVIERTKLNIVSNQYSR